MLSSFHSCVVGTGANDGAYEGCDMLQATNPTEKATVRTMARLIAIQTRKSMRAAPKPVSAPMNEAVSDPPRQWIECATTRPMTAPMNGPVTIQIGLASFRPHTQTMSPRITIPARMSFAWLGEFSRIALMSIVAMGVRSRV